MENKTPIREKAVLTRQKLLETTMALIAAKGYHNVTVDKIASAAGLSTGSAYRYFKNKKEMLIAAIEYYFENIQFFTHTQDDRLAAYDSIEEMLSYVLDQFYLIHKKYYNLHEELESLRHIDPDIKAVYDRITERAVSELMEKCPGEMAKLSNLKERFYVGLSILENFAHIQMYASPDCQLAIPSMKEMSIHAVISLIYKENHHHEIIYHKTP